MVKCPGVIGWKANARPPGWKVRENAPLFPGGGWALLELTDTLQLAHSLQCFCHFQWHFRRQLKIISRK